MLNPEVLLEFPLRNLRKLGLLNDKKISRATVLSTYLILILFCAPIILMWMQFFYINGDVTGYVNNLEGIAGCTQALLKWCLCLYNKRKFLDLVNMIQKFWTENQCSATTREDVNIISKRLLLFQRFYFYAITFVIFFVMLPFAILQKNLVVGDWYMEKNGMFIPAWIIILIAIGILGVFLGYHDGLYLGFCYELQIQCKILSSHLNELNVGELRCESQFNSYYQKLQSCINHHNLLLEFHDALQSVYSVTFLVQYLTAAPLICVEMYAVSETFDPILLLRYSMSSACVLFQIISYSIPANHVEQEMSTISMAIYNSDWYSKYVPKIRIPIILMIQRAQQKQTLTACGLIEMNIETFGKLIKFALTVCIALKSLKSLRGDNTVTA